MKHLKGILAISLSSLMMACSSNDEPPVSTESRAMMTLDVQEQAKVQSINHFGITMLQTLAANPENDGNVLFSPVSAAVFTGMLANGGDASVQQAVAKAFGMPGESIDGLNNVMGRLLKEVPQTDSKNKLAFANGMWFSSDRTVKECYRKAMNEVFDAEISSVAASADYVSLINKWCADKTGGLIKDVSRPEMLLPVTANASVFKGEWNEPFDTKNTGKRKFTNADGAAIDVYMMSGEQRMQVLTTEYGTFVQMPYYLESYIAVIMLPNENTTLGEAVAAITERDIDKAVSWNGGNKGYITMPCVDIPHQRISLEDALKATGLEGLFDSDKMTGITEETFGMNAVEQHSTLTIDEKGTKSTSVTVGMLLGSSSPGAVTPVEITVDRPYLFMVVHTDSKAIITSAMIRQL